MPFPPNSVLQISIKCFHLLNFGVTPSKHPLRHDTLRDPHTPSWSREANVKHKVIVVLCSTPSEVKEDLSKPVHRIARHHTFRDQEVILMP